VKTENVRKTWPHQSRTQDFKRRALYTTEPPQPTTSESTLFHFYAAKRYCYLMLEFHSVHRLLIVNYHNTFWCHQLETTFLLERCHIKDLLVSLYTNASKH